MNKDLYGKTYKVPDNHLKTLNNYGSEETIKNILNKGEVSYSNMKKIKNRMENGEKDKLGGDSFYNWINQSLGSDRSGLETTKKSESLVMNNRYMKPHAKDSLNTMNRPSKSHKSTIEKYDSSITESLKRINEIMKKII
jgi:hypothetical protein